MSKQREEVWYSPLEVDDEGVSNVSAKVKRDGFVLYWGQSTITGISNFPIIIIVAIIEDKETGKVHYAKPEEVIYKRS